MMYKSSPIPFQEMGQQIGQNVGQGYQNRQQLPWARPGFQGAPQGAAMGWNRQPMMPQQAQGMRPDMWQMLTQRFGGR